MDIFIRHCKWIAFQLFPIVHFNYIAATLLDCIVLPGRLGTGRPGRPAGCSARVTRDTVKTDVEL